MNDQALVTLGKRLLAAGYRFITPTPETHVRVNAWPHHARARDARDALGWSRPFLPSALPRDWLALLEEAAALEREDDFYRSRVRFSSLGERLFVHSAFPTLEPDSVFFGPDTYRFVRFLDQDRSHFGRVVDIGCGSGAGGLCIAARASSVSLVDINEKALRFSRINAAINGIDHVEVGSSNVLDGVTSPFDTVIANPPYLVDERARKYRDGGEGLGTALSVRIACEALDRLSSGGRLFLYSATPIVRGEDLLFEALKPYLQRERATLTYDYEELDPDVFGEELVRPAYADVERLAVVGLRVQKR